MARRKLQIDVSIIIVSWNVRRFLLKAISSIRKHTKGIRYEIIVIDNASSDNSVDAVRKKFPDITIIVNNDNVGFGTANNQGVKIAKGKYLLFLNPDTEILYNIIPRLIKSKEKTGAMLIGPEQVNHANMIGSNAGRIHLLVFLSCLIENTLLRHFPLNKRIIAKGLYPVKVLIGSFWLIKKKDFVKLGLFDESVFMYTEELYICRKINEMGGKIFLDRSEYYYHYHGASTKQVVSESAFHYTYTLKNYLINSSKRIFGKKSSRRQ